MRWSLRRPTHTSDKAHKTHVDLVSMHESNWVMMEGEVVMSAA